MSQIVRPFLQMVSIRKLWTFYWHFFQVTTVSIFAKAYSLVSWIGGCSSFRTAFYCKPSMALLIFSKTSSSSAWFVYLVLVEHIYMLWNFCGSNKSFWRSNLLCSCLYTGDVLLVDERMLYRFTLIVSAAEYWIFDQIIIIEFTKKSTLDICTLSLDTFID